MSYYSAKDIEDAINKVESLYKNKPYIIFVDSEEHKIMLEKYFPECDIRILPQHCRTEEMSNKAYVLPIPKYNPIKYM